MPTLTAQGTTEMTEYQGAFQVLPDQPWTLLSASNRGSHPQRREKSGNLSFPEIIRHPLP
jgi:hypothetical protein